MFNPIAAASLMGVNMEYFIYLNLALCIVGVVSIPMMKFSFKKLKESGKLVQQEEIMNDCNKTDF